MARARKLTQEIDKTPSLHVFRYARDANARTRERVLGGRDASIII